MQRKFSFIAGMVLLLMATNCTKNGTAKEAFEKQNVNETAGNCYQGRLEKRGICGQRVVKILSADKDGLHYAANWKDYLSGQTYEDVFTVQNDCDFPASIRQGETFTFSLVASGGGNCDRCLAETAVPEQKMAIKVGCTPKEDLK